MSRARRDPFQVLRDRAPVQREESLACINGELVPAGEACLSAFDHVVLYGDGVFETVAQRSGFLFKLDRHVERLYRSARAVKIEIPLTPDEFSELIVETVRRNGFRDSYTRCIVSRGEGPEPLVEHRNLRTNIIILPRRPFVAWAAEEQGGFRVKITSVRKTPPESLDPRIKSLNYLNNVLARIEAIEAGYDDALLLDLQGRVVEGSVYNVFLVRDGQLLAPPEGFLEGITREAVMELAADLGNPVTERFLYPYDFYTADEAFFCNTSRGIVPVVQVDGCVLSNGEPGPWTSQLRALYLQRVNQGWHGTQVFES